MLNTTGKIFERIIQTVTQLAANAIEGERWLGGSKECLQLCQLEPCPAGTSSHGNLELPDRPRSGLLQGQSAHIFLLCRRARVPGDRRSTSRLSPGPDTVERHVRRGPKAGTTRRMHCGGICGRQAALVVMQRTTGCGDDTVR